jgi:hypothetical protein
MRQCDPQHVILLGDWRPQGEPRRLWFRDAIAARARLFRFLIGSATVLRQTTFRYLSHAAEECYTTHSVAQSWDSPLTEIGRSKITELDRMRK